MSATALDRPIQPAATEKAIVQCAWCGRLKLHGRYVGRGLPIVHELGGGSVSHGICPDCHARLATVEAMVALEGEIEHVEV